MRYAAGLALICVAVRWARETGRDAAVWLCSRAEVQRAAARSEGRCWTGWTCGSGVNAALARPAGGGAGGQHTDRVPRGRGVERRRGGGRGMSRERNAELASGGGSGRPVPARDGRRRRVARRRGQARPVRTRLSRDRGWHTIADLECSGRRQKDHLLEAVQYCRYGDGSPCWMTLRGASSGCRLRCARLPKDNSSISAPRRSRTRCHRGADAGDVRGSYPEPRDGCRMSSHSYGAIDDRTRSAGKRAGKFAIIGKD